MLQCHVLINAEKLTLILAQLATKGMFVGCRSITSLVREEYLPIQTRFAQFMSTERP